MSEHDEIKQQLKNPNWQQAFRDTAAHRDTLAKDVEAQKIIIANLRQQLDDQIAANNQKRDALVELTNVNAELTKLLGDAVVQLETIRGQIVLKKRSRKTKVLAYKDFKVKLRKELEAEQGDIFPRTPADFLGGTETGSTRLQRELLPLQETQEPSEDLSELLSERPSADQIERERLQGIRNRTRAHGIGQQITRYLRSVGMTNLDTPGSMMESPNFDGVHVTLYRNLHETEVTGTTLHMLIRTDHWAQWVRVNCERISDISPDEIGHQISRMLPMLFDRDETELVADNFLTQAAVAAAGIVRDAATGPFHGDSNINPLTEGNVIPLEGSEISRMEMMADGSTRIYRDGRLVETLHPRRAESIGITTDEVPQYDDEAELVPHHVREAYMRGSEADRQAAIERWREDLQSASPYPLILNTDKG